MEAGRRLGRYELVAPLGEGGMGEVWRARDTTLDRDVALKVLPEDLAADPERLARLEREARLLAALSHPHIATIYDLEEEDGLSFLVLELIRGESLKRRLSGGPLPIDRALETCRQVAEALEAAHAAGIVHRDLKPANVLVTPDRGAKVLDFGIAKSLAIDAEVAETARDTDLTVAGTLVGTPAYMSPEQVRGETVDKAADIWSFGCLLYEMLTGRSAFGRETLADTLAAIVEQDPDWSRLPPIHPRIRMLLERCLEKDTRDRYHDIADARVDIETAQAAPPEVRKAPAARRVADRNGTLRWAAATAVTAMIAAAIAWSVKPPPAAPVNRFSLALPESRPFTQTGHPLLAVSPDGSTIVYVADRRLFLRSANEWESRPIDGTAGSPAGPFFSRDGRFVGYWDRSDQKLMKVPVEGGPPVPLDDAVNLLGASWDADDNIVYAKPDGIWRVSGQGGDPQQLVEAEPAERMHGPQILPDGSSVLFTLLTRPTGRGAWTGANIVVQDLDTGTREVLVEGADGRYVPTGHVVYARGNTLFAVGFDTVGRRSVGGEIAVIENVRPAVSFPGGTASRNWDFSTTGTLVYAAGREELLPMGSRELVTVDLDGNATPVTDVRRDYWRPVLSPDGERIAVEVLDGLAARIWIVELATGDARQLTSDGVENWSAAWTPDGLSVLYFSQRGGDGPDGIYMKPADGRGQARGLGVNGLPRTSSDDGIVSFSQSDIGAARRIGTFDLADPAGTAAIVLDNELTLNMPAISPDGRYIAYTSNASGVEEIWISPYPIEEGTAIRVSEGGGTGAVWSRDSSEIFYRGDDSIRVAANPLAPSAPGQAEVGRPRRSRRARLFRYEGVYRTSGNAPAFDVFPDGQRFVMVTVGERPPDHPHQINVVLNWFEELRRRVPDSE